MNETTTRTAWDTFFVTSFLFIASIFFILFISPINALFTKSTQRYKHLSKLRMDALCSELLEGHDFDHSEEKENATEEELQRVAHHISMSAAGGGNEQYPQLETIFRKELFWLYLNGYAENQRFLGVRMGFYLAVLVCLVLWAVV